MSYKTILVHLDNGKRSSTRLEIALSLASAQDAHLVGLFALSAPRYPSYALAEAGEAIREAEQRQRAESIKAGEKLFNDAVKRAGYAKAEWRPSGADALATTLTSARYADVVVAGQYDEEKDDAGVTPDFVEEVLLAAGRPVLIVPYAGKFRSVGKRVLVAWNASREAARAVHDAMPMLTRADSVQVVAFNPKKGRDEHGDTPGADIGLYLARHNVKVQVGQQFAEGLDIGSQILSRAADVDADLIVMGAYGHSRMREIVLGGATRTLIESMTVPVLMSH